MQSIRAEILLAVAVLGVSAATAQTEQIPALQARGVNVFLR